jgi:hypothetical protein
MRWTKTYPLRALSSLDFSSLGGAAGRYQRAHMLEKLEFTCLLSHRRVDFVGPSYMFIWSLVDPWDGCFFARQPVTSGWFPLEITSSGATNRDTCRGSGSTKVAIGCSPVSRPTHQKASIPLFRCGNTTRWAIASGNTAMGVLLLIWTCPYLLWEVADQAPPLPSLALPPLSHHRRRQGEDGKRRSDALFITCAATVSACVFEVCCLPARVYFLWYFSHSFSIVLRWWLVGVGSGEQRRNDNAASYKTHLAPLCWT